MKILRKSLLMLMMLAGLGMSACSDETIENGNLGNIPEGITINDNYVKDGVTVAKTGAELTVAVQSRNEVSASSNQSWVTIEKGTTTSALKVTPFKLVVAENTETSDREAQVTFTAGNDSKTIAIKQIAKAGLVVKTNSFDLPYTGGTVQVQLSANEPYEYEISDSWVSAATTRANMVDYTENFTVAMNASPTVRTATITFKVEGLAEAVTIKQAATETGGDMNKTAMEIASLMYPGWNLGNTMEAGSSDNNWKNAGIETETAWQSTKTTQQVIDLVKAQGFKSVRIPCAWVMGHITDEANCTIDPAWMNRVKEVVDYCISDGLYVIINQHWDGGWIEHNGFTAATDMTATKDKLTKIWTQIATAFKDYDEHLLFAGMNEPGVGGGDGNIIGVADMSARIAEYEQTFINAVRATGGNNALRVLIVQGPNTSINDTEENNYISKIQDTVNDRLMMEVHFYDPYQFCQMTEDAGWGKQWYYWGKGNTGDADRTANNYQEDFVNAQMAKMKKTFVDNGIPVLIGEFGAIQRWSVGKDAVHDASIKAYYRAVTQYAIENGCVPMVWDTNSGSGMTTLNRNTLKVGNINMMEGITEGVALAIWPAK